MLTITATPPNPRAPRWALLALVFIMSVIGGAMAVELARYYR